MNREQAANTLNENLSIQFEGLLPTRLCGEMIERYERDSGTPRSEATAQKIIEECADQAFSDDLTALLESHFQSRFVRPWSIFEAVDSAATHNGLNTLWHLDYGVTGALKLFIYLNPVSEHGGNTPFFDLERTRILRKAGALPLSSEERRHDLTPVLDELGVDPTPLDYDLKAGDGVLFSPLRLAHRCRPPKPGRIRYTVCFLLSPTR